MAQLLKYSLCKMDEVRTALQEYRDSDALGILAIDAEDVTALEHNEVIIFRFEGRALILTRDSNSDDLLEIVRWKIDEDVTDAH